MNHICDVCRERVRKTLIFLVCALPISINAAISESNPTVSEMLEMSLEDLLNVKISVASRFEETALQTGSSSSLITEEQWRSTSARKLSHVMNSLPSTVILPNWFGSESIYIRGYGFGNNTNGISTVLDGVVINSLEGGTQFTQQNINIGILDKIEMIRGPGSALYGESAFHGVLALHTFESDKDMSRVESGLSSNQFYNAAVKHSQDVSSKWRLNFSSAISGREDQNREYTYLDTNTNSSKESERDLNFNSVSASVKLKSDTINKTSYFANLFYHQNHYSDFYSGGTSSGLASRDTGGVESKFAMAQLRGKYHHSKNEDISLSIYYFKKHRIFDRAFQPFNTTNFTGIGELVGRGGDNNFGTRLTFRQKELFGNTNWSLELGAKRFQMGDYTVRQTDETGAEFNAFPLGFSDFKRDIYSAAVDSATYTLNNTLIFRYGFRFDDFSDFGSHFTPRLGVILLPTNRSAVKLLYGNAFRAPNAGEVKGFATVITDSELEPETIDTFELVLMYNANRLKSELVIFRSEWNEAITNVNFENKNTGENSAYGVESNFTYLSGPLTMPFSVSYIRSKNEVEKQDYVAFPKWIANAGLAYNLSRQQILVKLNNRIHLDAKEGQITNSFDSPNNLKDYWRTDLHISKQWHKQFSFYVDVRNLFNRKNFIPSAQQNPSTGGLPDEPLSFKVGIQYSLQ